MEENSLYFQKLNPEEKNLFEVRVFEFIEQKSIIGRQGFVVTNSVELLLAASAVQLTLGLETWNLDYFNQILIYPAEYKNPQTGLLHKGETNMGGFMCFSWADFLKGNQTPDDKINLGLHEFAHALRFSGIKGNATDYFFDNYFKRWLACAAEEYTAMRNGKVSLFRKYGAVNINEFFSVVVETFFETPQEFNKQFPDLYRHTSILLNQTTDEFGNIILNCREKLLKQNTGAEITHGKNGIKYSLPPTGARYGMFISFFLGILTLVFGSSQYPPGYILIAIAAMCWLYIEKKYTRIYFEEKNVIIEKGYLISTIFRAKNIPISQLIAIYAKHNADDKQLIEGEITYYYNGYFYEEQLYFKITEVPFKNLCRQLIANYVHVHVVD